MYLKLYVALEMFVLILIILQISFYFKLLCLFEFNLLQVGLSPLDQKMVKSDFITILGLYFT